MHGGYETLAYCRAMICKRGLCRHAVSVCSSVRHVREFCYNKLTYLQFFSPSGSHTILVFQTKRHGDIPTGTPLYKGGVECRWCRQKSLFWANIWLHRVLLPSRPPGVINTVLRIICHILYYITYYMPYATYVVTLIAGSNRRILLMAGDDDEMFMTKSFNVTPKTKE